MSQQNVELIRRAYDAFNRGDYEGWLAALDPQAKLDERYIVHVRGVGSGVETRAQLAHAIRIRNQKAAYIGSFPTVDEALNAVGLRE